MYEIFIIKGSNMSDEYKVIEKHHTPDPIEKWLVIGKVVLIIVGMLVLAYFFRR
jgi:hypothetical protein